MAGSAKVQIVGALGCILCALGTHAVGTPADPSPGAPAVSAAATPPPRNRLFRAGVLDMRDYLSPRGSPHDHPSAEEPPLPASGFNPDPGGGSPAKMPPETMSLFSDEPMYPPSPQAAPLPPGLKLPRPNVRPNPPVEHQYHYRTYPSGDTFPAFTRPQLNRWFLGFGHWKRYQDPARETPYQFETPRLYHPYQQSLLKGDVPVVGQDIFTNITFKNFTLVEVRKLPTPSGVSAAQPNSSEFFGRSQQFFISNDASLSLDIFKGETAFKPVDWELRVLGVYNINYLYVRENNFVDPDPRGVGFGDAGSVNNQKYGGAGAQSNNLNPIFQGGSYLNTANLRPGQPAEIIYRSLRRITPDTAGSRYTTRFKDFFALQEAFEEVHLADLDNNYDFLSLRAGIQPFVSDFRGFIFEDSNLGVRLFGNADDNRFQYNLVYFDMLEKDTYSDLNTFNSRDQQILIANVFRQDFLFRGYTAQFSFHANFDDGQNHYDKNTFLTRPALLGTPVPHDVHAYYLGWAGDGHIGRLNITHAFYEVLGTDDFNGLAGRRVTINAQMAAAELSYDFNWFRLKVSGLYASGDRNPTDGTARGFDTIQDNTSFIGGPFSWYVHQGFNLAGTAVNLKERDSLVLDLRSSKTEGQSNFVNPGVAIIGLGADADLTPKLRAFCNINYIALPTTETIKLALQTNRADSSLGLDCSLGFKYRPFLTDNVIISAGVGFFIPGQGYRDIYRTNTRPVPGYGNGVPPGHVDPFLYNVFTTVTFTY